MVTEASALEALQQRLQHPFADVRLLNQALTHRSFSADHNERLEFLGDSVLNLAVSRLLFIRLTDLPEGDLSRVRANLVKQDTLHRLALDLNLPGLIRLGEGELRSGGQRRPSILADALEALIGAVFLDAGYGAAEALVTRLFEKVDITPPCRRPPRTPRPNCRNGCRHAVTSCPFTVWSVPWVRLISRPLMSSVKCPS